MRRKRNYIISILILAILLIAWLAHVLSFNKRLLGRDEIPIINYKVGEWVPFGNNFSYDGYKPGFKMKANSYYIMDTKDYLKKIHKLETDIEYKSEKVCIVSMTIRYDGSKKEERIDFSNYIMCGMNYTDSFNEELYNWGNKAKSTRYRFKPGISMTVDFVYNLSKSTYTSYNWKHLDRLNRRIFITGKPEQKQIVLQE